MRREDSFGRDRLVARRGFAWCVLRLAGGRCASIALAASMSSCVSFVARPARRPTDAAGWLGTMVEERGAGGRAKS